jgi:hypothetical protein
VHYFLQGGCFHRNRFVALPVTATRSPVLSSAHQQTHQQMPQIGLVMGRSHPRHHLPTPTTFERSMPSIDRSLHRISSFHTISSRLVILPFILQTYLVHVSCHRCKIRIPSLSRAMHPSYCSLGNSNSCDSALICNLSLPPESRIPVLPCGNLVHRLRTSLNQARDLAEGGMWLDYLRHLTLT